MAERITELAPARRNGRLDVSVAQDGSASIQIAGIRLAMFEPCNVKHWLRELWDNQNWMIGSAAGYSAKFTIQGCREVSFVTNPDTGAFVKLPHPFIGALRVRLDEPRYGGPTKDILDQDEVRDFVHAVAASQLKGQWEKLRRA